MKKILLHIILSVTMIIASPTLMAQSEYQDQMKVESINVDKQNGVTTLSMNMMLNNLKINKNHMLIVTPIIQSKDGNNSNELAQVIIKGTLRNRVLNRPFDWKGKPEFDTKEQYITVRKNNTPQSIAYKESVAEQEWHSSATILIKTELMGCADCELDEMQLVLLKTEVYEPKFTASVIVPHPTEKIVEESHSAFLNYQLAKHNLLYDYKDNANKLDEVGRVINEVKNNKDFTFTSIKINGYASPEGPEDYNLTLSKNRANAFRDFIVEKYAINPADLDVNHHGEDWEGLIKKLEESELNNRNDIINIINSEPNLDARDDKIIALDNGITYNKLLTSFYPPLRRNDYTMVFIARRFDVEEAKEIIKTRPTILDLNEMFLVAQTYKDDKQAYNEVFKIAARVFPNDAISNVNVSAIEIEEENYDAAIERLNKFDDSPEALNNLGIALSHKEKYDEAMKAFLAAKKAGLAVAGTNAEELSKLLGNVN